MRIVHIEKADESLREQWRIVGSPKPCGAHSNFEPLYAVCYTKAEAIELLRRLADAQNTED